MTFLDAIKKAFIKCFDFKSRSSRSEFWYFYLFTTILGFIGIQIDRLFSLEILGLQLTQNTNEVAILGPTYIFLYFLFFVPSLSLYIRRLHDIDRSGWWLLIVIIPFVGIITLIFFWCLKGNQHKNIYGDVTN
tara:strand:- start:6534 stop:6932 length:399 start_codon:yes stop_codon:yes gene_type:complete